MPNGWRCLLFYSGLMNVTPRWLLLAALPAEISADSLPSSVELVYTGVGKLNAALTTSQAIARLQPQGIINFGTAGRTHDGVSGLVQIGEVLQRDMLAEPLSPRGVTPFCERPQRYFSSTVQEENLLRCGTGDSFVTAHDPWLAANQVDVVDMELFAIAHVAHAHGLPWQAFKYISDDTNEDSARTWEESVSQGQALFLHALTKWLETGRT
jgi:adenosylhomocysteine nucleosidase